MVEGLYTPIFSIQNLQRELGAAIKGKRFADFWGFYFHLGELAAARGYDLDAEELAELAEAIMNPVREPRGALRPSVSVSRSRRGARAGRISSAFSRAMASVRATCGDRRLLWKLAALAPVVGLLIAMWAVALFQQQSTVKAAPVDPPSQQTGPAMSGDGRSDGEATLP